MPRQGIPALQQLLVLAQLLPALRIDVRELREIGSRPQLVAAAFGIEPREPHRRAVLIALQIEGIQAAIERAQLIHAAALIGLLQPASAVPPREHHQPLAPRQPHEAARLVRHVHFFRRQPLDQRLRAAPEALTQSPQIVMRDRRAQSMAALSAAIAAKPEVLGARQLREQTQGLCPRLGVRAVPAEIDW